MIAMRSSLLLLFVLCTIIAVNGQEAEDTTAVAAVDVPTTEETVVPEVPAVVAVDGSDALFLAPTAAASVVPWVADDVDVVVDDLTTLEEADVVVDVSGDMEGAVIDVVELSPKVQTISENEQEEEVKVLEDGGQTFFDVSSGLPTKNDEDDNVVVVNDVDDVFVLPAEEESQEAALLRPPPPVVESSAVTSTLSEQPEEQQHETPSSLLESAVSADSDVSVDETNMSISSGGTTGDLMVDPREGVCTEAELDNVKHFFTAHEDTCSAYTCVADYNRNFFESLLVHYNELWAEGGDSKVNGIASLLSACTCRCDMMKCEVDFMKYNASPSCFQSTLDYCEKQNGLFVERCEKAATEYLKVVNEVAPEAKWNSGCTSACNRGDEPVAGLTLDVETAIPSAGEEESETLHDNMEEVAGHPSTLAEDIVETIEEKIEQAYAGNMIATNWSIVIAGFIFVVIFGVN
eukprot:GHVS01041104.1.p1 GENE.GHVS01041104.1~~GHVS01041104.1.p1  ORF type:complete len:462 (+),score=124.63 GHVS01041104.1:324-1709(+)